MKLIDVVGVLFRDTIHKKKLLLMPRDAEVRININDICDTNS